MAPRIDLKESNGNFKAGALLNIYLKKMPSKSRKIFESVMTPFYGQLCLDLSPER
jgi:hypothetical protein